MKTLIYTPINISKLRRTFPRFLSHSACFQVSIHRKSLAIKRTGWGGNRTPDTFMQGVLYVLSIVFLWFCVDF